MSSKAQNPCVARKAFCPRTWPSPQENPRDCPATQFKSTPPIFPRKPNQSADLQDTTLQLTGRQCADDLFISTDHGLHTASFSIARRLLPCDPMRSCLLRQYPADVGRAAW